MSNALKPNQYFKTTLLAAAISLTTLGLTACNDNDDTSSSVAATPVMTADTFTAIQTIHDGFADDTAKKAYEASVKAKINPAAEPDITKWINGLFANKDINAIQGTAGKLARGQKFIVVNANGQEYAQLIKKSLIGAYQFNGAVAEIQKAGGASNNQVVLDNVTAYLLGTKEELANGVGEEYTGNEFEHYLKSVNKDPDFNTIEADLYAALNKAKASVNDDAQFKTDIKAALEVGQKAIAVRTAFYLNIGAKLLLEEGKFATGAHATTEGLGFLHSFQFTHNAATGNPYYSQAEVNEFLNNLNLWDKAASAEKLRAKAKEIADRFGFTFEAAISTRQKDQVAVFKAIKTIQGFDAATAKSTYDSMVKSKVATDSQEQIGMWIDGHVKNASAAQASQGTAGTYPRGKKTMVINEQGIEYNQMVKKGLIGAYQLQSALAEASQLRSANKNNRVILENVTAYLLGDFSELAAGKGDSAYAGNEFEKYLKKVASNANFSTIEDDLYAALNAANANLENDAKFGEEIMKAINVAQKAVAVRAVHYLNEGAELITNDAEFANASHEASEGLGLLYSLQHTYNSQTHTPYYTKAEIDGFLAGLDLWNKAAAKQAFEQKAQEIAQKFGFDASKA